MPDLTTSRVGKHRWLWRGLIVLNTLILLVVGTLFVLGKSAESRWERLAAEIRTSGQPLTMEEVLASRPPVAPENDGGPIIHAALEMIEELDVAREGVLMLDRKCLFEFPERLDEDCLDRTRVYLQAHEGVLSELTKLLDYPDARLRVDYTMDVNATISGLLPVLSQVRHISKILSLDAAVAALDGDHQRASRDLTLMLRISRALNHEPILIAKLVALAVETMAPQLTSDLLHLPGISAEAIGELQTVWKQSDSPGSIRWALLGERALASDLMMTSLRMNAGFQDPARLLILNWQRIPATQYYSRLITKIDEPLHVLWKTAEREEQELQSRRTLFSFVKMQAPTTTRAIELHLRSVAGIRCTIAMLATERYRLAMGTFPQDLSNLIPDFLNAVPSDPCDGNPLRFKHEEGGAVVIYSIGEDLQDDGGSIDSPRGRAHVPRTSASACCHRSGEPCPPSNKRSGRGTAAPAAASAPWPENANRGCSRGAARPTP